MSKYIRSNFFSSLLIMMLVALFTPALHAQSSDDGDVSLQNFASPTNTLRTNKLKEVDGSPFYNEHWEKGYVLFKSGKKSKMTDLKYSTYSNEVLFQQNGTTYAVTSNTLKGFMLILEDGNKLFVKGFSSPKNEISPSLFLRVIYDGKVKLLGKYKTQLMRGRRPDPLSGKIISNYISHKDFFLVSADGQYHKTKLKDKDILRALGDHKVELKQYAKTHDLDWGDEQDLHAILSYYDSLSTSNK